MTRLFFTCIAALFVMFGITGFYLTIMWSYSFTNPLVNYPLRYVVDETGVVYPVILMIVGVIAGLLYLSFLRQSRGTMPQNPLLIDRITKAMRENW